MKANTKPALIILIVIILLLIQTVPLTAHPSQLPTQQNNQANLKTFTVTQHFTHPTSQQQNNYQTIHLAEANNYLSIAGNPQLPVFQDTYEFPLGTKIINIECTIQTPSQTHLLQKPIIPATQPLPTSETHLYNPLFENEDIYQTNELYPTAWYSYTTHGGLNRNNQPTTFLTLQYQPIRYNPSTNLLINTQEITLTITYKEPNNPIKLNNTYDFLIITNNLYTPFLKPLVNHKENLGISTKLVKLKEIYNSNYFPLEGRDKPEQIKYFIKNAQENWGITYVLLIGNFRKMPIRYSNIETYVGDFYEELKFLSDLYYADLYDGDGNFSSWDTDNDGIYGEWPFPYSGPPEDHIDLIPDVHLGRLACMFSLEVLISVNKIITYETTTYGSDWFNRMVVVGGDTFDKEWEDGTDYNEGEETTQQALIFMPEFTPTRLWTTLNNISNLEIHTEISKGCGFLYLAGHGNPKNWATHFNGDYINWTEGYRNENIRDLTNKNQYPILMVGGCHNNQFDVTPLNLLIDYKHSKTFSTWVPECWSWVFLSTYGGGAIASIGSTGYGAVNIGDHNNNSIPDCIEGSDGWFETQFFRIYNQENITILGNLYSKVIANYVSTFPVDSDRHDCKVVETHALFGDPTLKIGGYEQ